jgi:glycosyltransferase involved in cell wall biosynthesis
MPFFTVIIPTRNRPDLVPIALQSVLEQDFSDFEVIVSDNSDDENLGPTRASLGAMLGDPRVRYMRPPRVMPMVEHWEWATRQALGEFTGILTDRMSYRLYALRRCRAALEDYRLDLISFQADRLAQDTPPYRFQRRDRPSGAAICESAAVLAECSRAVFPRKLPRMFNSFCRTSVLHELVREYGSVYTALSPDYAFCFRALDHLDSFIALRDRLVVSGGELRSNGVAWRFNRPNQTMSDFAALSPMQEWFAYAPIPNLVPITLNGLMIDYLVAQQQQRSGRFIPMDKSAFYREARRDLRKLIAEGHDLAPALDVLEQYRTENGIPAPRPTAADRFRYLQRKLLPGLGPAARRARPLRRYVRARLAAISGRPEALQRLRGFPTVIELLRFDAAAAGERQR